MARRRFALSHSQYTQALRAQTRNLDGAGDIARKLRRPLAGDASQAAAPRARPSRRGWGFGVLGRIFQIGGVHGVPVQRPILDDFGLGRRGLAAKQACDLRSAMRAEGFLRHT